MLRQNIGQSLKTIEIAMDKLWWTLIIQKLVPNNIIQLILIEVSIITDAKESRWWIISMKWLELTKWFNLRILWLWLRCITGRPIPSRNSRTRWSNVRLLWLHRPKWTVKSNTLCGRFTGISYSRSIKASINLSKWTLWQVSRLLLKL